MGSAINPIVSGLQSGLQMRAQREQQKLEQQRLQNEQDYHQSLIEDAKNTLGQRSKEFEATNKIAQQAANIQLLGAQHGIESTLLTGGQVPGISPISEDKDKGTITYQASHTHPLMADATFTLPNPTKYAENQAALERINLGPKTEQKISEEQAKQNAEQEKQLKIDTAKLATEHQNKLSEQASHDAVLLQMRKDQDLSQMERTKVTAGATLGAAGIHSAAQIKAAQIRTGSEMFGSADEGKVDPSPYIKALQDGTLTQEQLNDQFKSQPIAANYLKKTAYAAGGIVPITNIQQGNIGALHQLNALVPKMEALANTSALGSPVQSYEQSKELQAEIAKVANTLGGDKGQRLQKTLIDKAEGFVPTALTPKKQALERVENFKRVLKETFEDDFRSQSKEQRNAIWRTVTGQGNGPVSAPPQAGLAAAPTPPSWPSIPATAQGVPETSQPQGGKMTFVPGKGLVYQ